MAEKLFVLGRPGSGKSAAFRYVKQYVEKKYAWSVVNFNDYEILYEMFRFEKLFQFNNEQRLFRPTKYGGFDVMDFAVLDVALRELEKKVRERYSSDGELIVIEFARNDYCKALELFTPNFLKDAHFLFIDADIKTCVKRIHERVAHPGTVDDYFVSEEILRSYYNKQSFPQYIGKGKVKFIENNRSLPEFVEQIERFVNDILIRERFDPTDESYLQIRAGMRRHLSLSYIKAWMSHPG